MSLLSIEWLKIKRYRTFWVLIGLFAFLVPVWNFLISKEVIRLGNGQINLLNHDYGFPSVWDNFGWWGSIFALFLPILIITLTCNEYTFRTHRQNVIDGWSRLSFFHAKVALVVALSVATTLFVFVVGAIFGISTSHSVSGIFNDIEKVGYYFILLLNYLGGALFIGLLIRRSGLAISLFLMYALIMEIAAVATINFSTGTHYGNFLPLQASDELLPISIMRVAGRLIDKTPPFPDYAYVIASLGWISVYYFAGRRIILNRDM